MLLDAANLSFSYGRDGQSRAIDGVSLSVEAGSIVGVLGPNGSGKTTLIKLLSGALRARHGDVMLDGVAGAELSRATLARRIAVVPQETHLAFDYTVLEIVLMGRYPRLGAFEIEGPDDIRCAMDALESTGTRELAARPFTALSGGERQRVIIASALAQLDERFTTDTSSREIRPILFMDEPTASLDLRYQLELAALLRRLNGERGITIVLSTHDLRLAASICTTVVMLANGSVLGDWSARRGPDGQPRSAGCTAWMSIWSRGRWHDAGVPASAPVARWCCCRSSAWSPRSLAAPFIGSTPLSFANVFSTSQPFADNVDAQIFFLARLPRTLAAAMVGGVLAAAGVVFQGLLQNPLASPYTLGVSAGAALGAMIAITFGAAWPIGGSAGASLAGAAIAVLVVYALATARHRGLSTTVLLLVRRHAQRVLLGADSLRPVPQQLRRHLPRVALAHGQPRRRRLRAAPCALPLDRRVARRLRLAGPAAEPAQPRRRGRRRAAGSIRGAPSGSRSSAGRSRPAPPCRSAARLASSASSCRTSSGSSSARTTGSCCRRRRSSARRFSSAATPSRARSWRRSNCPSASSPRSLAGRSSCGYS